MVPSSPGRQRAICRESAEEVRGHLSLRLRVRLTGAELWEELKDVVLFWVSRGVRIFRVDNPHTKPFRILAMADRGDQSGVSRRDLPGRGVHAAKGDERPGQAGLQPVVHLFRLAEYEGAAHELLHRADANGVREYFRPNLWTNTPDILTEYLQYGGRPAFMARFVLAATLGANYGIYGPAFELLENRAREPGSEEYLDSEKYQIRQWDLDRPAQPARVHPPGQSHSPRESCLCSATGICSFIATDNDQLLCYSRQTDDRRKHARHGGELGSRPHAVAVGRVARELGIRRQPPYQVHDLLGGARYLVGGERGTSSIGSATAAGTYPSASPAGEDANSNSNISCNR